MNSNHEQRRKDLGRYLSGLVGAAVLTALSFAVIAWAPWTFWTRLGTITALAVVQVGWQFYYFLHVDLTRSHRDDLELVLFTFLIMTTMIGGTLWILYRLAVRMA